MTTSKKVIWESAIASVVAGMALAAGAEAWAWISPMKRKERDEEDARDELDVEEVE